MDTTSFILGIVSCLALIFAAIGIYVVLRKRQDLQKIFDGSPSDKKQARGTSRLHNQRISPSALPFEIMGPTKTTINDFVDDSSSTTDSEEIEVEEENLESIEQDFRMSPELVKQGMTMDLNDPEFDDFTRRYVQALAGDLADLPDSFFPGSDKAEKIANILNYVRDHVPDSRESTLTEESKNELKLYNIIK